MKNVYEQNAKVFKALCDPNRLMILEMLQSGEACACVLLEKLAIGQPTLSHHMKILVESEIVNQRKQGKWMFYCFSQTGIEKAKALLNNLTNINTFECEVKCL